MSRHQGCLVALLAAGLGMVLIAAAAAAYVLNVVRGIGTLDEFFPSLPTVDSSPMPFPSPTVALALPGAALTPIVLTDPTIDEITAAWGSAVPGQELHVLMSEDHIQAKFGPLLSQVPEVRIQLQDVALHDGLITLFGSTTMSGLMVNMSVTVRPIVANCWFTIELVDATFGRLPAPRLVMQELEGLIAQWNAQPAESPPMCITNITITAGQLSFIGTK